MTLEQLGNAKTGNVVEAPRIGVSRAAKRLICLVLALMCTLWITPFAQAADALGTMTDDITDPQNLLGSNVFAVTDKVKQTKADTGVTVRLLYVDSFGETAKPVDFVTQVLESVNPNPNTVMLAVASGDGSLVVASSSNSDEWLRKESTIDALSKAAYDKLATSGEQDWSGAAIAMMDQIATEKKTDTSSAMAMVGVIGLAVTLVALVAVVVVAVVLHRRKARNGRSGSRRGRRRKHGYRESLDADELDTDESQTADSQQSEASEPIEQSDVAFQYTEQPVDHSADHSGEEPAPATETESHESDS